jgi:hypothetical protein
VSTTSGVDFRSSQVKNSCTEAVFTDMVKMEPVLGVVRNSKPSGCLWLTPAILATQEAEIRRIKFEASPGK